MVASFRQSSRRDLNTLDIVLSSEISRWLQIIIADFHNWGKYSKRMRPLNIRMSWAMTFLLLCFSALLVMPFGLGAFLPGNLRILLHTSDGKKKIDLTW